MRKVNIGIVGVSGLVGEMILKILSEYGIEVDKLVLYGSKRSANEKVIFNNKEYHIMELRFDTIDSSLDIVFFAAGNKVSQEYANKFVQNNTFVIDNSSFYRMDDSVKLIVPEVNGNIIKENNHLIANPNCTTIQSVLPLKVIDDLVDITRIDYTTYQAVSGSGYEGINDLKNGTNKVYPYDISKNLIPLIDEYQYNGYSKEEQKMINETRKILNKPKIAISATCVRVPIVNTHAVSIRVEVKKNINLHNILEALDKAPGITLKNETVLNEYPINQEVDNQDNVFVGRVRKDLFNDKILHFYCVGDNIRKGAASNSVQIAQILINNFI